MRPVSGVWESIGLMLMHPIAADEFRSDRSEIRIRPLGDDNDFDYWQTQTYERRLLAAEFLRENIHGHEYRTQRLERVLRIIERQ